MTEKRRFVYLFVVFFLLASTFLTPPAQVYAQDWRDLSADVDGDGLPNVVEENGWYNAAGGPYMTDDLDADSDDDGLTDGQEKLYDTDPFDDYSPGIYVTYREDFQTKEYFPWQGYGSKYIALPYPLAPWGEESFVVRRGTTFSVGGPLEAEIEISKSKSSLTDLIPVRDPCAGRWNIAVPADGTVGIYTITLQDGSWDESLNLYVIFQLPTNVSDAFIDAFVYDDNVGNNRDEVSITFADGTPREYTRGYTYPEYPEIDFTWIPWDEWVNHGHGWGFFNRQYRDYVFEDHVIEAINGHTDTWNAANALSQRADEVTCFGAPRVLTSSWCVLNPSYCPPYDNRNQCSNIADLLTAFNRAAGIPARPVFTDWPHASFDHATEVWTKPSWGSWDWYLTRGYRTNEYENPDSNHCASSGFTGGYNALQSTSGWYGWGQGVYAAGKNWSWSDIDGVISPYADDFRQSSWDNTVILKKGWWETRFVDYWGWSSEPQVIGTPPDDWPPCCPPPPVAGFAGSPLSGTVPLTVTFTDQSTGHVRYRAWDFGDESGSTAQNPSHTYETTGDFTVSLTVTGAGGSDTEVKTDYIQVEDGLGGQGTFSAPGALQSAQVVADEGVDLGSVIEFGQVVADEGVDQDGDGRFDQLVFEIEVNALRAGDYWLRGMLGDGFAEAIGQVYLAEGLHTVELSFNGMDIYLSKVDGPYLLEGLWVTDVANPIPSDFAERELAYVAPGYETSPYKFSDFGVAGATLSGDYRPYAVDTDDDGYADALVVETSLNIEKADTYTVQGVLYDGQEEMVSQATWTGSGPAVTLQFDGLRDTVGPYSLQYLHVGNAAGQVSDGIREPYVLGEVPELRAKPISLGVGAAIPRDPSQPAPLFVVIDGYSDAGVDTDGDGQFDQLVITVDVEVEAGEGGKAYRIEGWLVDKNNALISWAIGDAQVLAEGVQSLSLAFDGRIIHEHGVDGPLTLMALKALPGGTYDVLDEIDVAYTTPTYYYHDQFEEVAIAPAVSIFGDDMENDGSQWTAESPPWSLNDSVWYSYSHAWKAGASGSQSGSLTTISLDISNCGGAPALRFRTCYNMQSPSDVGYLEVSANGDDWTEVATYTNSTSHWSTELIDLSDFGETPNLQLRFNANSQSMLLWYVDDVYLNGWPVPGNDPPNEPSNPSPVHGATNQPVTVDLSWTGGDPDGDSVTYDVYFEADDSSPEVLVSDNQTGTSFDPGTLECGTDYYWMIVAQDEHRATASGDVWHFTTHACSPPSAPTNLEATAASHTQIDLTWWDNSSDETAFRIERSTDGVSGWTEIATVGANVTSYSDTGLSCETPYYYRVRAYRGSDGQYSDYSDVDSATTQTCPPSAPTNLEATAASQTQINLTWQDNSSDESDFHIERSPNGTTNWTQIATVGASVTSYSDTGLSCGTTYYYRIRAHRHSDGQYSAYSNVYNATTQACPPPSAPINLEATATSQTQINLTWQDNSSDESDFHIERSLNGSTGWTGIGTVGADVTSYSDTGLDCGTIYYYRVRAHRHSDGQYSGSSNVASATTQACPPLSAPTNLSATAASQAQIDLSWTDNSSDEISFYVERSPDGVSGWTGIGTVGASVTSYSDTGLSWGTTYYYRVRAHRQGDDQYSGYSNVANATTLSSGIYLPLIFRGSVSGAAANSATAPAFDTPTSAPPLPHRVPNTP